MKETTLSTHPDGALERPLYIPYAGPQLLETALLNKGSAFSEEERKAFNLEGLLPYTIENIDEQVIRCYEQLQGFIEPLDKHIYLRNIQDINETLFYKLVSENIEEIMPIIYTPTVGVACQQFSRIYRRKRGLFISYPDRDRIDDILQNATKREVKVVVVTDGERILGLGDQGIGGMGIPIGKLSLYTACGGISSANTLPIVLDTGCNNQELLEDPLYMGWRHKRINDEEYFDFVDHFIHGLLRRWPDAILQFEDFSARHAKPLLEKYREKLCCFNDDIQGTAAVAAGTLLAACRKNGSQLRDQRIIFTGAGSAGCGIAEQLTHHMMLQGLTEEQAKRNIYLIDSRGLVEDALDYLKPFQRLFAKDTSELTSWPRNHRGRIDLETVIRTVNPTVLIGVSGQANLFTEKITRLITEGCSTPIFLPLSNPTSKSEAIPEDIIQWTDGRAIIATGSPFPPVTFKGRQYTIPQCNNVYIFPGLGLGVMASKAKHITDGMFIKASETLSLCASESGEEGLLPQLSSIRKVSRKIAKAVAIQAMEDTVAPPVSEQTIDAEIFRCFWQPQYREYRRTSF